MNESTRIISRDFLLKCPSNRQEKLFNLLPKQEQEKLAFLPNTFASPSEGLTLPENALKKVHFSHLITLLQNLDPSDAILFFSALTPEQQQGISQKLELNPISLTKLAARFLNKTLYSQLTMSNPELLPIECLPESPLNQLLSLPLNMLLKLIQFWGLHDLAHELHYIIDKDILLKIQDSLSTEEQHYLQGLMQQQERLYFARLHLEQWNRNNQLLRNMIHQRGLNRLAKALNNENKSLLWHLAHHLDIGRAALLKKYAAKEEESEEIAKKLKEQALELLTLLN